MKNKKIWMFHPYATPPTMNGFNRPYNFATKLLKNENQSVVFTASHLHFSNKNVINNNELFLENNESSIPFIFVRTSSSSSNGLGRVFNMLSYYINIFKVVKEYLKKNNKPDIIIASSPHPLAMIAGIKIAKKLDVPCICEIRDFWPEVFFMSGRIKETSILGRLLIKGEYWIYRNADSLIFLKEGDVTYITDRKWDINQGGKIDLNKCHYINNGVDIDKFQLRIKEETVNDSELNNGRFNVVYTGTIRPVNNIDKLVDTAKLLMDYTDIQFLIYGEGSERNRIEQRLNDENINNVLFKGYLESKFIPYVLSKSSVNILNYSQDKYNWSRGNSSNKLFEYMASGKPIISTVKMGYSPIEKYDCGISIESNTSEELAEAILKIYNIPEVEYTRMCENSIKGSEDFDYEKLTKKLISIMECLIV